LFNGLDNRFPIIDYKLVLKVNDILNESENLSAILPDAGQKYSRSEDPNSAKCCF
jgi:hypothetical protein